MAGKSHQWAALESQHERLVDSSGPLLADDAPRRGRKLWHRRAAGAAHGTARAVPGTAVAVPQPRHSRRRAARPDA
jgi:hypothetical protein